MNDVKFRVVEGDTPLKLENKLNEWVASLPERTKIRRTQLACSAVHVRGMPIVYVYVALVNYELPEADKAS